MPLCKTTRKIKMVLMGEITTCKHLHKSGFEISAQNKAVNYTIITFIPVVQCKMKHVIMLILYELDTTVNVHVSINRISNEKVATWLLHKKLGVMLVQWTFLVNEWIMKNFCW